MQLHYVMHTQLFVSASNSVWGKIKLNLNFNLNIWAASLQKWLVLFCWEASLPAKRNSEVGPSKCTKCREKYFYLRWNASSILKLALSTTGKQLLRVFKVANQRNNTDHSTSVHCIRFVQAFLRMVIFVYLAWCLPLRAHFNSISDGV